MKKIVKLLTANNKTIAFMESCTGGALINSITNIPGASEIVKFSAVAYSNEFKIKMGVKQETINTFSVYSMNVAKEMSKQISEFASSNYGVGITGKLMAQDKKNLAGDLNCVFISIFDSNKNKYFEKEVKLIFLDRVKNKKYIVSIVEDMLLEILK